MINTEILEKYLINAISFTNETLDVDIKIKYLEEKLYEWVLQSDIYICAALGHIDLVLSRHEIYIDILRPKTATPGIDILRNPLQYIVPFQEDVEKWTREEEEKILSAIENVENIIARVLVISLEKYILRELGDSNPWIPENYDNETDTYQKEKGLPEYPSVLPTWAQHAPGSFVMRLLKENNILEKMLLLDIITKIQEASKKTKEKNTAEEEVAEVAQ